jgi:plasmid stabilization system protein ParE
MIACRFTESALADLNDIQEFLDDQRPGLGDDVRGEVRHVVAQVQHFPYIYPQIEACPEGRKIRGGSTNRFPVLIVYEILPTEIIVLAVTHAHRPPGLWRNGAAD